MEQEGKIICLAGGSGSGKDTMYKHIYNRGFPVRRYAQGDFLIKEITTLFSNCLNLSEDIVYLMLSKQPERFRELKICIGENLRFFKQGLWAKKVVEKILEDNLQSKITPIITDLRNYDSYIEFKNIARDLIVIFIDSNKPLHKNEEITLKNLKDNLNTSEYVEFYNNHDQDSLNCFETLYEALMANKHKMI